MESSLTDIPNAISGMGKMEELDLNNNRIRGVNQIHFAKMVQLRKLNLANNKISSLDPLSFHYCDQLEELDLSNNLIREVSPIHFVAQVLLRKINLSYNRIHSLGPRLFQNCKNLKYVDFSNNLITIMDQNVFIGPSQSLRYVDLRNNKCDTFHKCIVAKLQHFETFYFSTEFFNCDCRLAWIRQLSYQFGSRISVSGTCYQPRELYGQGLSSYPLDGCTLEDESFESCNIVTTTPPDTKTEPTSKPLNRSFVNSAQISSLQKDLSNVQTITTMSASVAVVAVVAFVATLVVLLTCFFKQRNRVPIKGRVQGHVNQGVKSERLPEGQSSGDSQYQNTAGTACSAPSGAYEPLRKDGRGLKQHGGQYAIINK
ncbi:slit homolog 2 protein-like [Lingula anatina]|uniref:Slit homolog 2 protein-like n=1 Tax=Lingula anatina TaxID=7574 RepID=A0A1S3KDX1_LINAN|nr:slit homolog 2 protein-like [Lingula anatina]|eukprot:XP_013420823.1 slit homolog 2 protein-like [Lingula anatina]